MNITWLQGVPLSIAYIAQHFPVHPNKLIMLITRTWRVLKRLNTSPFPSTRIGYVLTHNNNKEHTRVHGLVFYTYYTGIRVTVKPRASKPLCTITVHATHAGTSGSYCVTTYTSFLENGGCLLLRTNITTNPRICIT